MDDAGYAWAICPSLGECLLGPQESRVAPVGQFVDDALAGGLPNFSVVSPRSADSQHNRASMTQGDSWIGSVVGAAMRGPDWSSTAVFVTYDDCGCFFDHVRPPAGLGIRVPMVIVSPYARPGFTDSSTASFASILALTEHTFGLTPLASDDTSAYDYANAFDFSQTPLGPAVMVRRAIPVWERRWVREHAEPDVT
jgi:phospholipase C